MSVTDGLGRAVPSHSTPGQTQILDYYGRLTLAGDLTLTKGYRQVLGIDPGGAGRDVILPAEATSAGLRFRIVNRADAAETLTVKDDGGATVATIGQNESAEVWCDGTAWYLTSGINQATLS